MSSFLSQFNLSDIFKASMVLFAVIDVIGSIPIIIKIKEQSGEIHPLRASIVSLAIMTLFLILGEKILHLFSVEVEEFAVAGKSIGMFFTSLFNRFGLASEHQTIVSQIRRHCISPGST